MNERAKEIIKILEDLFNSKGYLVYFEYCNIELNDKVFTIKGNTELALTDKVASIRGELTELAEPYDKSKWHNNLSLKQVLSVPSLSLPASREENDITK
jgi:hypothetical protein